MVSSLSLIILYVQEGKCCIIYYLICKTKFKYLNFFQSLLAVILLIIVPIKCFPQFKLPELPKFPPPAEIDQPKNLQATTTQNNLEETVKEVENMLKANPSLPRLTRGEILDLLENITKTDALNQNGIPTEASKDKQRDPKAVMLVKPYTPENEQIYDMEELYTKPPVTQIVGAQSQGKPIEDNIIINTSR